MIVPVSISVFYVSVTMACCSIGNRYMTVTKPKASKRAQYSEEELKQAMKAV
jgi:hypothetical protein